MENCSLALENCSTTINNNNNYNNTESPLFIYLSNSDTNSTYSESCSVWVPAQHNLFQISNLCFFAAFLVPRTYKHGIIILRVLLCIGFFIEFIWSGVHICSWDIVLWSIILASVNMGHVIGLTIRLVPPSLSPELTELYIRMFQPLKVSRKHFKELVKEGSIHILNIGEDYAVEDETNADERLSILLRGKLKVTCDNIHLHYISTFNFIDSPEWEAGHVTSDELFQVTITAEEECMYLCWPKLKLDRVLRHRPMLRAIVSNLIGKDITQKLYWLNEAIGVTGSATGKDLTTSSRDQWRKLLPRSQSADAVDTGSKGHVRSLAWRKQNNNKRGSPPSDSNNN